MKRHSDVEDVIILYEKQYKWLSSIGLIPEDDEWKYMKLTYFDEFIAKSLGRKPNSVRKLIQDYRKNPLKYKQYVEPNFIIKEYNRLRSFLKERNVAIYIPMSHYVEEISILYHCEEQDIAEIIKRHAEYRGHHFGKQ